jgi:hypothetical protein
MCTFDDAAQACAARLQRVHSCALFAAAPTTLLDVLLGLIFASSTVNSLISAAFQSDDAPCFICYEKVRALENVAVARLRVQTLALSADNLRFERHRRQPRGHSSERAAVWWARLNRKVYPAATPGFVCLGVRALVWISVSVGKCVGGVDVIGVVCSVIGRAM